MKSIHKYLSVALSVVLLVGCNGFLDREAEGIIPNDDVFKDDKMTLAALANLYGRVNWGRPSMTIWPISMGMRLVGRMVRRSSGTGSATTISGSTTMA